jgi:hypothetical protein
MFVTLTLFLAIVGLVVGMIHQKENGIPTPDLPGKIFDRSDTKDIRRHSDPVGEL